MEISTIAKAAVQAEGGTPSASQENVSEPQELVLLPLSSETAMKNTTTTNLHESLEQVSEEDVVKTRLMDSTAERPGDQAGELRLSASKRGKGRGLSSRRDQRKVLAHRHGVGSLDDTMMRKSTLSMGAQPLGLSLPLIDEGRASTRILFPRPAALLQGQASSADSPV